MAEPRHRDQRGHRTAGRRPGLPGKSRRRWFRPGLVVQGVVVVVMVSSFGGDFVMAARVEDLSTDKAASRFLGYLEAVGAGDLAALGVREVSGFFLRQRRLRRKTVAALRSCLADFLCFLAWLPRVGRP